MFWNKLKWEATGEGESIKDSDIIRFNQKIKDKKIEKVYFRNEYNNVIINLTKPSIILNGEKIFEKNIRNPELLNFRRKKVQISLNGEVKEELEGYGIGLKYTERERERKTYILINGKEYKIMDE